jgi:V8-like Glu-specific endopeptidase
VKKKFLLLSMVWAILAFGAVLAWSQYKEEVVPQEEEAVAQTGQKVGDVRSYNSESPHPYSPGRSDKPAVWTENVISPGAKFVRVHFVGFNLASGDFVTVSSPDGSQRWTYTGRGPNGDGDFWAFAIDGDTATVQIRAGLKGEYGYRINSVGHGTVDLKQPTATPEVVCGTDGREDIACHSDTNVAQKPIARLLFVSGGSQFLCTGWLAAGSNNSTLVTNNHCFSTQTEVNSLQAKFNFQRTSCNGSTNAAAADFAGGTFLRTNTIGRRGKKGGLDYTICTLQGNPEATWGELTPTTKAVAVGDKIWFIQHPGGREKEIGYYEDANHTVLCKVDTTNQTYSNSAQGSQIGYGCDSEGGSSGSPIVDAVTGRVIALHHFGGVTSSPCLNSGTSMKTVCADAGSLLSCASN